jgi:molybdate transport system substrate-binding protein
LLRRVGLALGLMVSLAPVACGTDESDADVPPESGEIIRVFAASSLTEAFEELAGSYNETHPHGPAFSFNFLSSSDLATQLEQGAEADVYASADVANMAKVVDAGLVEGAPKIFVRNELQIVVASHNPLGIESLEDLADPDLVVALCVVECPAGTYAREALDKAGVTVRPDSLEPDVKAVAMRVELGEADAGIVYASDVAALGDSASGVPIPQRHNVIATYPIAVLKEASSEASGFVDLVLSKPGREVLEEHGFLVK